MGYLDRRIVHFTVAPRESPQKRLSKDALRTGICVGGSYLSGRAYATASDGARKAFLLAGGVALGASAYVLGVEAHDEPVLGGWLAPGLQSSGLALVAPYFVSLGAKHGLAAAGK